MVSSSSLIPHGDPTLLFTNAGMNQFKDVFTGKETRSYTRATSSQKCMRVSGKHNDLEEVGLSPFHHTFFEMLGNFSFGDYFKQDAIFFGWDWVTRVLGLPKDRLYATVYEDDDEAFALWEKTDDYLKKSGRILRFGKKDNYWAMGDTGPNGPCSEIHFDRGDKYQGQLNVSGNRFLELWNLVFMQFESDGKGNNTPLPKPSIDTGAGLERISLVMQGIHTPAFGHPSQEGNTPRHSVPPPYGSFGLSRGGHTPSSPPLAGNPPLSRGEFASPSGHPSQEWIQSDYDTDLFRPIIERIAELSDKEYFSDERGIPHRVIADHLRALMFGFSDGAYPSNEGRGYVLRRILRRASYHCRLLDIHEPLIYQLVPTLISIMGEVYPEIVDKEIQTTELIKSEEESFGKTLDRGLEIFFDVLARVRSNGGKIIPGAEAFKLYDTYGFPIDLTEIMARKEGFGIEIDGYEKELQAQRERSREGAKGILIEESIGKSSSDFVGYQYDSVETAVTAIQSDGEKVKIVLDETPFYAESGGQIGDTGHIIFEEDGTRVRVEDTQKQGNCFIHIGVIEKGKVPVSFNSVVPVKAIVDSERRGHIKRNHTATHLLHKALRGILGDHATQAGSYVGPDRLRFDFTHYKALTDEEINQIETMVNRAIMADYQVNSELNVPLEEAKKEGAMALFGEKYGEKVRVIRIKNPDGSNYSIELCGGTHVNRTGEIGSFVIMSESAIAAGMRRIEALTGGGAIEYLKGRDKLARSLGNILKAAPEELPERIEKLLERNKELSREIGELSKLKAIGQVDDFIKRAVDVNGHKVVSLDPGADDRGQLMNLADALREKLGSGVGVLGSVIDGKVALVAVVTDDLIKTKNIKAGDFIKKIAVKIDGTGGGRPHLAQAGGKSPEKLPEALKETVRVIEELLR